MPFADFLAEGAKIPEGSALEASTSQTVLPAWYTNYAMNLLSGQQALGSVPYTTYQGPKLAGFTPDQMAGFDLTKQAAGAYAPGMGAAMTLANAAGGMNALGTASPMFNKAAGLSGVTAAQPFMQGAAGALSQGTQTSGLNAAMPFINRSAVSATNVNPYMNPYIDAVVNRVSDLGARNLREKFLPEIEGRYIRAGQWGGSGQMTDTARAVRDVGDDVLAQQGQLLRSGYDSAQGALQTDLSRFGQLGATVGNLGATEQGNLLRAGELGANIGQTMGQLTQNEQQALTTMGASMGNLAAGDAAHTLDASKTLANLGGLAQQYGLAGANAVTGVGDTAQKFNQQNIDAAYSDFLKQQGYPQDQIDKALATFKGVAPGVPTGATKQGIVPVGGDNSYKPGTAASIVGALTAAAGIGKDLGWL